MAERDPKIRFLHMHDYTLKALKMIEGQSRAEFDNDEKLQLALSRLVELIGESANTISPEIQSQYPEIPWPKIIGMRHRLIHGYDFVDYDILWNTVNMSLPQLLTDLSRIIDENF